MPKPDCVFQIKKTGPDANGLIVFATDPSFASCTVHIRIDGDLAGAHMGGDVADYHVVQVGPDNITVRHLADDPRGVIEFEVDCTECGPTRSRYGDPSPRKWPRWLAILIAPLTFLLWLLLFILKELARKLNAIWNWLNRFWNWLTGLF